MCKPTRTNRLCSKLDPSTYIHSNPVCQHIRDTSDVSRIAQADLGNSNNVIVIVTITVVQVIVIVIYGTERNVIVIVIESKVILIELLQFH